METWREIDANPSLSMNIIDPSFSDVYFTIGTFFFLKVLTISD